MNDDHTADELGPYPLEVLVEVTEHTRRTKPVEPFTYYTAAVRCAGWTLWESTEHSATPRQAVERAAAGYAHALANAVITAGRLMGTTR